MYESLTNCCQAYYSWDFDRCVSSQGKEPPTGTGSWYVRWDEFICVQSCEGPKPYGDAHDAWNILHDSKSQCCQAQLPWKEDCITF